MSSHRPIIHSDSGAAPAASLPSPSSPSSSKQRQQQQQPHHHRPTSLKQFPGKLHDLMTYAESNGLDDVIGWVHNGSAFMVHDQKRLLEILPIFFGQTKFRSFQRQLNMWRFERVLVGPYKGAFMHPFFIRGNKSLCESMTRNPTTTSSSSASLSPSAIHHFHPHSNLLMGSSLGVGVGVGGGNMPSTSGSNSQYMLGLSHNILDRNPSPQEQLTWAEYTRRQEIMKGIESADVAVDFKNKRTSSLSNNNRSSSTDQASMSKGGGLGGMSVKQTPADVSAKLLTGETPSTALPSHFAPPVPEQQEESWSILSDCLERVMNNSPEYNNHHSHNSNINDLEPDPLPHQMGVTLGASNNDLRMMRRQDLAALVVGLSPGIEQPATPEQLQDLFYEMSGHSD
mmetsp:Transcript_11854/g.28443  ORF Transcript_11854/g.28443 Transcript_11854/m.28443 type:complete len:398 (+) Transcript_11854:557-1750(+)